MELGRWNIFKDFFKIRWTQTCPVKTRTFTTASVMCPADVKEGAS